MTSKNNQKITNQVSEHTEFLPFKIFYQLSLPLTNHKIPFIQGMTTVLWPQTLGHYDLCVFA